MNKDTLEETKKSNKQSEAKKGSSDYLNSGMNSNANDATPKAKGQFDNEYATNGLSTNASNADMSNMIGSANDATSEETKKLNERSATNKWTTKR